MSVVIGPARDVLRPIRILAYESHAKTRGFARRVDESRRIIRQWLDQCERPYVALSGGKDSSVVAHLVARLDPSVPMMHVCSQKCMPEQCPTAEAIAETCGAHYHAEMCDIDVWEALESFSRPVMESHKGLSKPQPWQQFFRPLIDRYVEREGCDGAALGLRADESRGRAGHIFSRGPIYTSPQALLHCMPIGRWSTMDVFAYIVSRDLPLCPVYAYEELSHGPHAIRVGQWTPSEARTQQYCIWLRRHYPAIWQRLSDARPELRQYA